MACYDINSTASGSSAILNNVIRKDGETLNTVGTNHAWAHRHVGVLYAEDTTVYGNLDVSGTINGARHGTNAIWGVVNDSIDVINNLRYDSGYLQYKYRTVTVNGGIITDIADETDWTNVYGWLYGA